MRILITGAGSAGTTLAYWFHANWTYLFSTLLVYNLLTWLKLLALPETEHRSYAKRLRFRFIAVPITAFNAGSG
jgi:hypothetical protein